MTMHRHGGGYAAPRSHWVLLFIGLAVLVTALTLHGVIHDQAGRTGTRPDGASPTLATADRLGPVIDARGAEARSRHPSPRVVALTFDDGPDPVWTPKVLDLLERHRVPGTFFVVGSRVALQPGLVKRIVASGSEIGVHTFTHVDLSVTPSLRSELEMSQTQLAIAGAAGVHTALMRPPFSSTPAGLDEEDYAAVVAAAKDGYVTVLATHDTQDWGRPGVDAIVKRALPTDGRGAIILLHDGGGDRRQTVAALEQIIPRLKQSGYTFATVSDAVGQPPPVVEASGEQRWLGALFLIVVDLSEVLVLAMGWALVVVGALTVARLLLVLTVARHHARTRRRRRHIGGIREPVSVIIPAFNEAAGIARTVTSVLESAYPLREVIVIDDGSTDETADIVTRLALPGVRVIRQPNRGKAAAIQAGVLRARSDLLVLLDGDTVFEPGTIDRLVQAFADPSVGAVAGNAKVGNRRGLLAWWQHIEYVIGFNLDRRMYDVLDCMPTVPGAVGAFRRRAILDAGGVSSDTLAEDTDLTMAVLRAGWRVTYEETACGWTEAPATLGQLWRQRYRWCYGTLQAMWKHRRALVSRGRAGRLGRRGLVYVGLFHVLLPLMGPVLDIFAVYGLTFLEPGRVIAIWLGFLGIQLVIGVIAFRMDREPSWPLVWLPLQQFVYRQVMYLVVIQSLVTAVLGATLRWHKLDRRGTARVGSAAGRGTTLPAANRAAR